ncbi:hypothetical protein BBF96_05800 [Anoxybacter fermentans]|uniref:Methyltransferase domain-containing protein n=1 Tax=Anoxybacter fermentans TaxID=1323375 RepID=A0A3Q9HQ09_9FIRM|nr:class I SAM-dependent methyltransferase [Anoxybacter fermentans]AZR72948.1 hypothetical protein BBF96_05800 [Anoxybacter fermentans]
MKKEFYNTEYEGFFAEFYDVLHSNEDDALAFISFAKEFGSPILELGCGTGRLLIPLARKGFEITGMDLSEAMLEICRNKLEQEEDEVKDRVTLVKADMRDFNLEKKFKFIFTACNTLMHLSTIKDLEKAFKCIATHLTEDGVFIIDISAPDIPYMVESNGKEFVFEYTHPETGRKIIDRFKPTYDFLNQIEKDEIILEEYEKGEMIRQAISNVILTYFFPRELKIILQHCGFEIFEEYGSLNKDPLTEKSQNIIFLCRKSSS